MEQEAKEAEQAMERKMAALTAKLEEARRQAVISSTKAGGAGAGAESPSKGGYFDDSLDSITTANANDLSFSYVHETRPVNHGPAIGLTPREGDAGASEALADLDRPLTPQNDENDNSDHFLVGIPSSGDDNAPMSARSVTQPVISVVETSFGAEELDQAQAEEEYYVVEESDDDDGD